MNKICFLLLVVFLMLSGNLIAEEMHMEPYQGSAEFEQLKAILGNWEGTGIMHDGKEEAIQMEYYLTSNGSAIVEKAFPGTPKEMISVYHDAGGKLSMTHYCAFGNQPQMDLASSTASEISFSFADRSNIDVASEDHMHSLKISFPGENQMAQEWAMYSGGIEAHKTTFNFKKV